MKNFLSASAVPEVSGGYGHVRIFIGVRNGGNEYSLASEVDGIYADGLRIYCQMDKDQKNPYAMRAEYVSHSVGLYDAERMVKTLKKVRRAVDAYQNKYGTISSYGLFCSVVCDALKIRFYEIEGQETTRQHWIYNVNTLVTKTGDRI